MAFDIFGYDLDFTGNLLLDLLPDKVNIDSFVIAEKLEIAHDILYSDIGGGFHLDLMFFGKSEIF